MTSINQLLTPANSILLIDAVFLVIGAIYGGVAGWRWVVAGDLISKGIKVEGRVFSKLKEEHRQSRSYRTYYIYFVTYVYDYNGIPYEHTQNVSGRHYERFQKGQTVAVSIMPNDPNVAQLVGADADSSRITRPARMALLFIGLALFFELANVFHWFKK